MIGPGVAKARLLPLVVSRPTVLVRAPDPRWRDLFERADTVSEGAVREEAHGRMWYGSTSLILPIDGRGDPRALSELTAIAAHDVHVRVRALRAARLEACSRAPCRLGRVSCEIRFTADARGVRIDVDVQAPLIERRTARHATR